MSSITVAIWMVTYNHELYIEQAIRSVMQQQTNFVFKLVIGEDCSTDNTKLICERLIKEFPKKIELVVNTKNLGSTENAIQIYKKCYEFKPKYIALLEGDDYWTDPLKLQKQIDFLETHQDYSFCLTRFLSGAQTNKLIDKNAHFFKNDSNLVYDFDMFTKGWFGGTLTLIFKTSEIDVRIYNKYKYFRDVHVYTELLKNGTGCCLNFISGVYRIHDQGQHNSLNELEQAKAAVNCYRELYIMNTDIDALRIKYRYFQRSYIKELVFRKNYFIALKQSFMFGLQMKDFNFIVSNWKRILKKCLL